MPRPKQQRNARAGYVLVVLLVSSAIVLVTLTLAIPRMAIQSQRIKEETLMYRGKQYQRAIELYFREHNKYPQDLDDLEDTNGVRYLRRRYKDPLTGEDEWRIIHMGTDGRFKDSLIYDQAEEKEADGSEEPSRDSQSSASGFGFGERPQTIPGQPRRLPEQPRRLPGQPRRLPEQPLLPGQFQGGGRVRTARQSAAPDPTEQIRYNQGFEFPVGTQPDAQGRQPQPSVGPDGQPVPQPSDYRTMLPSQIPMYENQPPPPDPNAPFGQQEQTRSGRNDADRRSGGFGRSLQPSAPIGSQFQGGSGSPPGAATGGAPAAFGASGVGTSATNIIQRLLTTPRPGGLEELQGNQQIQGAAAAGGMVSMQEGIAGVASTVEDFGVKTYGGRMMYNEWEFVYDYRKEAEAAGMNAAVGPLASGLPQGAAARGLGMNPGMLGGVSPAGQQARTNPRSPAAAGNYPAGFGAAGGQAPGAASRPGSGYGAQPSGTPSPYSRNPGLSRPAAPPPLFSQPPAPNADSRKP